MPAGPAACGQLSFRALLSSLPSFSEKLETPHPLLLYMLKLK